MQNRPGRSTQTDGSTDFLIRINFRQHTTWQGEIEWLDGRIKPPKIFFRSLLEMIRLMQEAVEKETRGGADEKLYSWDDGTEENPVTE